MDRQDIYNFLFIDKEDNNNKKIMTTKTMANNNTLKTNKTTGFKATAGIISGVKHEKVYGENIRAVKLNNKKYLFVSDLCEKFGTGFIAMLDVPPIKQKINYGANTQNRYIVTVTDFRNAMNKKAEPKVTENVEEQEEVVERALRAITDPTAPKTTDAAAEENKTDLAYRSDLVKLIQSACDVSAEELGYVPGTDMFKHTVENLRISTYKDLYKNFRNQLRSYLAECNLTLESIGLGYVELVPGVKQKTFLQRVYDAGYIKDLYLFAINNLSVKNESIDKIGTVDNIPM
jgi:hypothetical protein